VDLQHTRLQGFSPCILVSSRFFKKNRSTIKEIIFISVFEIFTTLFSGTAWSVSVVLQLENISLANIFYCLTMTQATEFAKASSRDKGIGQDGNKNRV